jgi:SAM-dependent methyltransferase
MEQPAVSASLCLGRNIVLRPLAAVFLLSASALLFQFAQTRLFSATLSYHLSFLVVSGALLGVATGGTAAAVLDGRKRAPPSENLAFASGMSALVVLFVETQIDPLVVGMFVTTVIAYGLGVIPVLFASWVIVRALRESPRASGTIYAADLAGAAAGGLLGYIVIGAVGDQGLYGICAGFALLAAAILQQGSARTTLVRRAGAVVLAVSLVAVLAVWGDLLAPPRAGPLKSTATDIAEGMVRDTARWDPLARIDVLRWGNTGDPAHYAFLIDPRYDRPRPPSFAMELDMGALTPIIAGGTQADLRVLDASILSAPYAVAPRSSVLVIGPGGGIDVLTALDHGARSVVAVEVNRTVVDLMRTRYAAYGGNLYSDERIDLVEDEARSFVRRSPDRYDLIVMTVVDSFAALSSGAYALTESYLYTDEAMEDYLRHLAPGGTIALSRWYRDPPTEIVRTFHIAEDGLARLGVSDAAAHILVLRYGNFGELLIGANALTPTDIQRVRSFAEAHGFAVAYDPSRPTAPFMNEAREAPATDDRPFFFDTVPIDEVLAGRADLPYGYAILLSALVLSIALAIGGALSPLYQRARAASGSVVPRGSAIAIALGFGFIAAELVLLQRLTLYLGQPSLALAIGIAALLGGAACGSALSARIHAPIAVMAIVSALALFVVLLGLPAVTGATLAAPFALRVFVSFASALIVGGPLGTIFPKVVTKVGAIDAGLVSWIWAMNGTASVIGSILGTAIALSFGFTGLGLTAVAWYAVAALAAPRERRTWSAAPEDKEIVQAELKPLVTQEVERA